MIHCTPTRKRWIYMSIAHRSPLIKFTSPHFARPLNYSAAALLRNDKEKFKWEIERYLNGKGKERKEYRRDCKEGDGSINCFVGAYSASFVVAFWERHLFGKYLIPEALLRFLCKFAER